MASNGDVMVTGSEDTIRQTDTVFGFTTLDDYPALLAANPPDPSSRNEILQVSELVVTGDINPATNAIWPGTKLTLRVYLGYTHRMRQFKWLLPTEGGGMRIDCIGEQMGQV
jgi:hypothetical protein